MSPEHQILAERRQAQRRVLEYSEKREQPEVVEEEHRIESNIYFLAQILQNITRINKNIYR